MDKAQWTTKTNEITASTDASGTFSASVPLYDSGVKAATLQFVITADRSLTVYCINEPGSAGLTGFQAWSKEG